MRAVSVSRPRRSAQAITANTPAVLWAILVVVVAQLAFTYLPWMQALFDTRAVALIDGVAILGIGLAFMVVLEFEKLLLRRWGVFADIS